jgi:hypothetical protein
MLSVPDEGYSRNPSCALNLISTFSLKTIFSEKVAIISYLDATVLLVEKGNYLLILSDVLSLVDIGCPCVSSLVYLLPKTLIAIVVCC